MMFSDVNLVLIDIDWQGRISGEQHVIPESHTKNYARFIFIDIILTIIIGLAYNCNFYETGWTNSRFS